MTNAEHTAATAHIDLTGAVTLAQKVRRFMDAGAMGPRAIMRLYCDGYTKAEIMREAIRARA